jgi:hypothetical protein
MVSAAAGFTARLFAPRGLPLSQLNHIGVFKQVANAHVDRLAGGGRAQSAHGPE